MKWSEEAENEYLESVKSRATEKVRALLLQAKRRSDEIVREAELHAQEITAQAEKKAQEIEQKAQATLGDAEQRYQDVYDEAVRKGHEEIQQILAQNQQILGESTAVVLLSIHEQIAKFYDVWKEDLKQLTLDAIEVGTGWVANTEKEAILKQLLDESVQKLIDKKNFIVRVNPADAELITQVLENSREKNWSMESSKELEPGSLELESDNVYVKNSRSERQKFVQDILDNLVLPRSGEEELLTQHVKDTLNREMQNNPVLAHSMQQAETPVAEIPLEKLCPIRNIPRYQSLSRTQAMQMFRRTHLRNNPFLCRKRRKSCRHKTCRKPICRRKQRKILPNRLPLNQMAMPLPAWKKFCGNKIKPPRQKILFNRKTSPLFRAGN